MMKLAYAAFAAAALSLAAATALAHSGGEPKHGGVVSAASELAFELVPGADGVTLYVEDHGKPFGTSGLKGRLVVLQGTNKSEAELLPAGDNRLQAKGVRFGKGDKAVATLNAAGRKPIVVRFSGR